MTSVSLELEFKLHLFERLYKKRIGKTSFITFGKVYKGILYMLLSSLCFALINICVKILTGSGNLIPQINNLIPNLQEYPPYELVFFRSIISLTICIAIIRSKKIPFFGNNKKWLIIRGFAGVTSLTMFFFTLKHLPIAVGTIVQYLSPIFTILFAIKLQKEKVQTIQWFFFSLALIGVGWIGYFRDGNTFYDPIWLILGLASAVISGIAYNAIMKCRTTDAPITVVMYFPLIATPLMLGACIIFGFVIPIGPEWILLLTIGLLTQIAQVTMTRAFHADSAARVSPVKYVGAIYALATGAFIFDETLGLFSSIGIVLILIGVLLNTFYKASLLKITKN